MNAPSSFESGALDMVFFMAGGYRFAVEAAQVRTQLSAGQSGTTLTVEQLLGLSCKDTQNIASRRILLMKHSAGDYAVEVSSPVELRSIEINTIHPLPSLIAARTKLVGIQGLAIGPAGLTVLVDFRQALTMFRTEVNFLNAQSNAYRTTLSCSTG